jgi:TPR repeat protein
LTACNNLAWLYEHGDGVAQDKAQARSLYLRACDGGIKYACDNLRLLP